MRASMRVGRGIWISGGGGVFASAVAFALVRGLLILVLACVAAGVVATITLAMSGYRGRAQARRRLVCDALALAVQPGSIRLEGNQAVPAVTGLYAVGRGFLIGAHPKKLAEIQRLYPDRQDELACVGLFPDRASASSAKGVLLRHGFSARELNALFLAGDRIGAPAHVV